MSQFWTADVLVRLCTHRWKARQEARIPVAGSSPLRTARILCATLALTTLPAGAQTSDAEAFFNGKTLSVVVGYEPGGGFDLYGRLLAEFLGAHVPGVRAVTVRNMPGAASMVAANWVYAAAPQDGTVIFIPLESTPLNQVLQPGRVSLDATKFQWLGRLGARRTVGITRTASGVGSIAEAKTKTVRMGATGADDYGGQVSRALNELVGTKFELIIGYKGSREIYLSMDKGELDGITFAAAEELVNDRPDWLRNKAISVLYVNAPKRITAFPEAPAITELATSEADRKLLGFLAAKDEIGRSFVVGPGVPKERVDVLRKAFADTVRDPKLIEAARLRHIEVDFAPGEETARTVRNAIDVTPQEAERYRRVINPPER